MSWLPTAPFNILCVHSRCKYHVMANHHQSVSFAFGIGQCVPCAWKYLDRLKKVKFNLGGVELGRCRLLVKAVAATLEPKSLAPKGDEWFGSKDSELGLTPNPPEVLLESSDEDDSEELDEREKLRRTRISKANKGSTPWNKGRKHSAETLWKIKERTRLAMQNPKVMSIANVKRGTKVLKQIQLKKSKSPAYKDPSVGSKLAMIKSIRAQTAVAETKQANAIEQARLSIAEAEKAAKALEVAAAKSPIAQASLIESRKLIAEAIQSLESIDTQGIITVRNVPSFAFTQTNKEKDAEFEVLSQSLMVPLNGHKTLSSSDHKFADDIGKFSSQKLVNGDSELHLTSSNGCASYHVGINSKIEEPSSPYQQKETEQDHSSEYNIDPSPAMLGTESVGDEAQPRLPIVTKNWDRGRLVGVVEYK